MRTLVVAVVFSILILANLGAASQPERAPDGPPPARAKKIVLIPSAPDHAWGTHMYVHECNLLAHCLTRQDERLFRRCRLPTGTGREQSHCRQCV